jgi:hypothetical protein
MLCHAPVMMKVTRSAAGDVVTLLRLRNRRWMALCSIVVTPRRASVQVWYFTCRRAALTPCFDPCVDHLPPGFDESVVVDISVLPPSISIIAFVVNVHEGGSFLNVETAKATVQLVGGAEVTSCSVGCGSADTGLVLALLHRQMVNGSLAWCFRRIGKASLAVSPSPHESRASYLTHTTRIFDAHISLPSSLCLSPSSPP